MAQLVDFLNPLNMQDIGGDVGYTQGQFGAELPMFQKNFPDLSDVDIVFLGVEENRGAGTMKPLSKSADTIRKYLFRLHRWHGNVALADVGNIKVGATVADSYAALQEEAAALLRQNKTLLILGGSHDNTIAQYRAYKQLQKIIELTCIDATFDLSTESRVPGENFLMEVLTSEPNFVSHYNHIGFQSYFVHPRMLETIDKLHFDSYRVGLVQTEIEEMEPVIRGTDMLSFDVNAIKHSDAPANKNCPNGFTGVEACMLMRYAGMSEQLTSLGIYGYEPASDLDDLTAKQISQMIWYFIDGRSRRKQEAPFGDKHAFNEFHNTFSDVETVFLQSKRTGRWWMKMPDGHYVPGSYMDYVKACRNEIPERWLRLQERGW